MWPFLCGLRYTCSRPLSPIKLTGGSSTPLNYLVCDSRRFFSKVQEQLAPSDGQRRTIYALSTPPGKAGIAVVRVSGPDALLVWKRMVRTYKDHQIPPKPWKLERCHIILPDERNELLDDGLAVFFRGEVTYRLRREQIHQWFLVQHRNHLQQRTLSNYIFTLVALLFRLYSPLSLVLNSVDLLSPESSPDVHLEMVDLI
jgi:hypothetical protein